MTREEAISLSAYTGFLLASDFSQVHKFCEDTLGRPIWTHEFADSDVQKEIQEKLRPQIMELVQNIAALRPVSREQVEKSWAGCEYCEKHKINLVRIEMNYNDSPGSPKRLNPTRVPKFCPICGRPLTDEAVETIMKRMEEMRND